MTYRILSAFAALLLLASCKETPPPIDYGPKTVDTAKLTITDTSFTAAPEAAQDRVVVIEEFTGVKCPPCPQGHVVLAAIEQKYPNRVAIVGIQPFGPPQSRPLDSNFDHIYTRHDNRSQKGTEIATTIFGGLSSIPIAGIDRSMSGSSRLADRSAWVSLVDNRITIPTSANVTVSSNYDATDGKAVIKVHIAYTQAVAKPQKLTVAIVEDSVIDGQEGAGTNGFEQNYVHMHVLRDILTAATGSSILGSYATKMPGLVYESTFNYRPEDFWNLDHCRVIAFVSNDDGDDKEVQQAAEAHLK